jgi:hypothetical protein
VLYAEPTGAIVRTPITSGRLTGHRIVGPLKSDVPAVAVPVAIPVPVVGTSLHTWDGLRGSLKCAFNGREFGLHVANPAALHFYLVLLAPYLGLLPFDDASLFFEFLAKRVPITLNHSASSRKAHLWEQTPRNEHHSTMRRGTRSVQF